MAETPLPTWPHATSPFHEGELEAQMRAGARERMERQGRKSVRAEMPRQHQEFFAQLPFLIVGSVAADGQPWASVVAGPPGFVTATDPTHLAVNTRPLPGDPLHHTLSEGAPVGLLGIELHTRRRNRLNGIVDRAAPDGFTVRVRQSFGNCPQYIQLRDTHFIGEGERGGDIVHQADHLDEPARRMVAAADTLFIATAFTGDGGGDAQNLGADVSHRGGKPGFVRIDGDRTLTLPDFLGNSFFNTIGNLLRHPRAGLLLPDFATGDLLYLAADAEVVWDGPEVRAFAGAERLIRLHVKRMLRVEHALPLRFSAPEYSPFLARTGSWEIAAAALTR